MKELIIELTNRCLNNCIHCSSKNCGATKEHNINIKELDIIINAAIQNGFKRIVFSGGEPVLHPDFVNIIKIIHSKSVEIKMYTSGVYYDWIYNSPAYREVFKKINRIILSYYSDNNSINNNILRNLDGTNYFKKSFDMFKNICPFIELNFVPMRLNIDSIDHLYTKYVGHIDRFNVLKLVKQGNALIHWEKIMLDDIKLLSKLENLSHKPKVKIGNSFGLISNSEYKCEAGRQKMCITFDGYIIPCEVFKSRRNLFKHYSEYINNSSFSKSIENYSKHEYVRGCQASTIQIG